MKKLMILLSLGVVCSLCGCGQGGEDTTQQHTAEEMTAEDSTQEDAKSEEADMTTEDVTDEQTVTDWEAAPVIAYVVWFHTFGAALPQSQIPCAGSIVRQRIHVILKKQPTLRKGDRHESISQP